MPHRDTELITVNNIPSDNSSTNRDNKKTKKCKYTYWIYTLCIHIFIIASLIAAMPRHDDTSNGADTKFIIVFVLIMIVLANLCVNILAFYPHEELYGMDIGDLVKFKFCAMLYNIAVIITFIVILCVSFDSYDSYFPIATIITVIAKTVDLFFSCCTMCY
jgi:hypothetical protein